MSETTVNLDKLAAERSQQMVNQAKQIKEVKEPIETLERLVTKTLGVLQAQGIYAMMLFLFSRSSDEAKIAPLIREQLYEELKALSIINDENVPQSNKNANDALAFYTEKILDNLDTLLLVRDLYEQTLIYARYHAKALGG